MKKINRLSDYHHSLEGGGITKLKLKYDFMHELSIVQNILEITEKEVLKAKATKVEQIDLDVGMLSGIEMQALLFAWEACVPGTVLAGARRQIRRIPAKAKCVQCENIFDTQNFFDPFCQAF